MDFKIEDLGAFLQEGRQYARFDEYCKDIYQTLERANGKPDARAEGQ